MRNYLTIAGRDSRDFGVYISGQGTFSAPERAYEFLPIPGRDGALIGNEKRLENMEVSYEAFIYENFSENIANFRSFLLSLIGYQRLEDSYHPDEFRMACYVGPFEPEVEDSNDAGKFTITFNCKPQRYLKDGETTYVYGPQGTTISGSKIQAYGSLIDTTYFNMYVQKTSNRITSLQVFFDGSLVYSSSINKFYFGGIQVYPAGGTFNLITGELTPTAAAMDMSAASSNWTKLAAQINNQTRYYYRHAKSGIVAGLPYGVAPSKYTSISASSLTPAQVVQKSLTANKPCIGFDSSYIYFYSSEYDSASAKPADVGTLFGSKLICACSDVTQSAYTAVQTFSPEYPDRMLEIIGGPSVSFSGSYYSAMSIKYTPTDSMINPSVFPSKPLIRAYGTGTFDINDITITITTSSTYTDIDCDLMDCYEGSTNRNNSVSFSTYDFPILQPGENLVQNLVGVTLVEITPRWWRL